MYVYMIIITKKQHLLLHNNVNWEKFSGKNSVSKKLIFNYFLVLVDYFNH